MKHWEQDMMPPTFRHEVIVFIDDSLDFPNMNSLVSEFEGWGNSFSDSDVAFQIGYNIDANGNGVGDEAWWGSMADPAKTMSDIPRQQGYNRGGGQGEGNKSQVADLRLHHQIEGQHRQ